MSEREKTRREFLRLGLLALGVGAATRLRSPVKAQDASAEQLERIQREFDDAVRRPRFPGGER